MILSIARREWLSWSCSPMAWTVLAAWQAIGAYLLLLQLDRYQQLGSALSALPEAPGITDLVISPVLASQGMIGLMIIPLLSMGLIAGERSHGRMALWLSAPLGPLRILLGKYIGLLGFVLLLTLAALAMPLSLYIGAPLDLGKIAAAGLGLFLLLATLGAIGLLASSYSQQVAPAAIGSLGLMIMLWMIDAAPQEDGDNQLSWLSLSYHFQPLLRGLVSSEHVLWFLGAIGLFLSLALHRLSREPQAHRPYRRWLRLVMLGALMPGIIWLGHTWQAESDWSANGRNSLSRASTALLDALPASLEITAWSRDDSQTRQSVADLLSRYQRHRPDIDIRYRDPERFPEEARRLNIGASPVLLFRYQERSTQVDTLSESAISQGLHRLLNDGERFIAFLSGHGERRFDGEANHDYGNLGAELARRGLKAMPLDMNATSRIPDNIQALVVADPQIELLAGERRRLQEYLDNGGNLLILADTGGLKGLEPLLATLGTGLLPGIVVDAATQALGIDDPSFALVTQYPPHQAVREFGLLTLFPRSKALVLEDRDDWISTPLLQTLDRAWTETSAIQGQIGFNADTEERAGPLTLAIAFERDLENTDGTTIQQRIIVGGDADFLSNSYIGNGGNLALGVRLLEWLSEGNAAPNIPISGAADRTLNLGRTATLVIGLGFLIALPLFYVACGFVIRGVRRRA